MKGKVFFLSIQIEPSISPFLKDSLEIIYKTSYFLDIIELITKDKVKW